jgi:hypothetical protein
MSLSPRREPAQYALLVSAILAVVVATKATSLTADQATLIVAALMAIGAVVAAVFTRPLAPAAFLAVSAPVAALIAGFGYNVAPDLLAGINGLIMVLVGLLIRMQVSPVTAVATVTAGHRSTF